MAEYRWSAPFNLWDLLSFQALRIWPEDGFKQVEFIRHCCRTLEINIEKAPHDIKNAIEMTSYLNTIISLIGGREALAELNKPSAFTQEIEKRTVRGQWAGAILTHAHILYTGNNRPDLISWNRIVDFIERESHTGKGWKPVSKTVLVESWRQYETVAHLWAAHMYLGGIWHQGATFPDCSIDEEMKLNLAYSKTFQDFGLSFKARNSKKFFLNPDILHKINIHFRGEIAWGALPAHLLESLEDF